MKYIFLLSGDYTDLGAEEIVSLFDIKNYRLRNRLIIFNFNNELPDNKIQRLALTKNIYRFLFECKAGDLIDKMKTFDWNSAYKDNFCLRKLSLDESLCIGNKKFTEKNLAGYIWRNLKSPKVNLENPRTEFHLFFFKNKAYCGLLVKKINYDFDTRKSHLRPFPHPSSLHPKVARALVNLSEIKENEILLDPFCGTGGFLIEAGLMGIRTIGYDINKIMIKGCIENLKYFKVNNAKIKKKNAININDKFDCVVTDLPYGLNSNAMAMYEKDWKKHRINKKIRAKDFIKNLEKFYLKFLKILRKKIKEDKKAAIVFPSYVDYKKLLKKSKFKIEFEFSNYVHRSLTRKIVKVS